MKAMIYKQYGSPDVVQLAHLPDPTCWSKSMRPQSIARMCACWAANLSWCV